MRDVPGVAHRRMVDAGRAGCGTADAPMTTDAGSGSDADYGADFGDEEDERKKEEEGEEEVGKRSCQVQKT